MWRDQQHLEELGKTISFQISDGTLPTSYGPYSPL